MGISKEMARHVMSNALFWMKQAEKQELGALGEMYVRGWLISQGYDAQDTSGLRHKGDISVMLKAGKTVRIEVKTAKQDLEGNYQFCLRKKGKTDISHSDFVVLLAIDNHGYLYRYLVPRFVFGNCRKCSISSHPMLYAGRFARFLVSDGKANLSSIQNYQMIGVNTA